MKNPAEIDRDLLIRMHSMYRVKETPYCPVVLYYPYFGNEELKKNWNALYHLLEHAYEKTVEKFPGCFDATLVEKKGLPYKEGEIKNVIECIEYLLEMGADINLYAFGNRDVLEDAFENRNEELINFMFEHGLKIQQNSNIFEFCDGFSIYDLYQQSWLMEHYWWQKYEYEEDYSDM